MFSLKNYWKESATYFVLLSCLKQFKDFFETFGQIGIQLCQFVRCIFKYGINVKSLIRKSSDFAFDSLPITLTIVGMTAIILSMQIAPEMAKQGGGGLIGMMSGLVMVREIGAIMAGFAIISMIGSSMAAEIATMRVTDQIDALTSLKVDSINYLFVPRVLAGMIMMPIIVVIASTFGLICAGWISTITADISWLNFFNSLRLGLVVRDISISLLKSSVFGATIALISSSCGFYAKGGAKGVGIATTKAVVWSFLAIAVWDYIFALLFYL